MPITALMAPFVFFEAGSAMHKNETAGYVLLIIGVILMISSIIMCTKELEDDL